MGPDWTIGESENWSRTRGWRKAQCLVLARPINDRWLGVHQTIPRSKFLTRQNLRSVITDHQWRAFTASKTEPVKPASSRTALGDPSGSPWQGEFSTDPRMHAAQRTRKSIYSRQASRYGHHRDIVLANRAFVFLASHSLSRHSPWWAGGHPHQMDDLNQGGGAQP